MKKEDKNVIKEIMQQKNLEQNLPRYAGAYMNAAYEYNLIHLVLNYYTMREMEEDTGCISSDDCLSGIMHQIHTLLFSVVLSKDTQKYDDKILESIQEIRKILTEKMTVLTAYTDGLQLQEYILNRMEYAITKEEYPVEESALAAKVFRYLFQDADKMVVNSKIQMVTAQLPIRMTKNRFFDYLNSTLNIYTGSEQTSVDNFVEMLKSTALLETPKGYGSDFVEVANMIKLLEETDYKTLDKTGFLGMMEQFSLVTEHLTKLVSAYLLAMEIVNDLYAVMLALPYETSQEEGTKACMIMLKGLHDSFVTGGEIPDSVDDGFMQIEGIQELLGEDIMKYESILPDVMEQYGDTISWALSDKIFKNLSIISKLSSNSLFIELTEDDVNNEIADSDYIAKLYENLVHDLQDFFKTHTKEMNRAVMAAMFSNMPVLFNSQQEIKEYIEYSLNHCGNQSELMACAKILNDLMEEE